MTERKESNMPRTRQSKGPSCWILAVLGLASVAVLAGGCGPWLSDPVSRVQEADKPAATTIENVQIVPASAARHTSASAVELDIRVGGSTWRLVCVGEAITRCQDIRPLHVWHLDRAAIRSDFGVHDSGAGTTCNRQHVHLEVQHATDLRPVKD